MSTPQGSLFGTDGIRGAFGEPPLDRDTVFRLGVALARRLSVQSTEVAPAVVIGGDTRESTPTLLRWMAAGLEHGGARAANAGVLPTPGIAHLTRCGPFQSGVVLSASHNPYHDNGIKIFASNGYKLDDEEERLLTEHLFVCTSTYGNERDLPIDPDLRAEYERALLASLPRRARLDGLSVVLDCGNGAASDLAGPLFASLGAEVIALHDAPDGRNINLDCGSTHVDVVARATREHGAAVGFSFDGDADRVLFSDETGAPHSGDEILYLWARNLHERGDLEPAQVVATSMSNLGLEEALSGIGIGVVRCGVGDREVVRTLRRQGLRLGGEQSGHIIDLTLSTTGDGIATALQLALWSHEMDGPLSAQLQGYRTYPQVLLGVRVRAKPPLLQLETVRHCAEAVERELGSRGRLVLRYSGTEPLARVMVEGADEAQVARCAHDVAAAVQSAIGEEQNL